MLWAAALGCMLGGCNREPETSGDVAPDAPRSDSVPAPPAAAATLRVDTLNGPPRLRPQAMTDARTLWGLLRGRLTRVQLDPVAVTSFADIAWDVAAGAGAVAWRNENGTWLWREAGERMLLADAAPKGEFDGPPDVLFAPDGRQALLSWRAEWSLHHELLAEDGERRTLAVRMPGYMMHAALLWLDDARILFSAVATGPVGGAPEYRESGWRGDLAVLDLRNGSFRRVTDASDGTFLRAAGTYRGAVVVTEYDAQGPGQHWLYDPQSWTRRALPLPAGRAYARGEILILLQPAGGDSARALVAEADSVRVLGTVVQPDETPAFAPDGRTAVLRVGAGNAAHLLRARVP